MAQALVPLKDLVKAKSRLGGLLHASERRALVQAMVEDVLYTLCAHPAIERVTLVSDDPGAHLLASRYGTFYWTERELGCSGLNPVIAAASERLLREGPEPLLVLHGDLPLLSARDIDAVLACEAQLQGLVIGTDRAGTGTNLLALGRNSVPKFAFGANSCALHQEAARQGGFPVQVLSLPGLALDVDDPGDLAELLAALEPQQKSRTAALLRDSELGERVTRALSSLDGDGSSDEKTQGLKR
jgi:2-phospho-L-lactate guanylyltransferase